MTLHVSIRLLLIVDTPYQHVDADCLVILPLHDPLSYMPLFSKQHEQWATAAKQAHLPRCSLQGDSGTFLQQ